MGDLLHRRTFRRFEIGPQGVSHRQQRDLSHIIGDTQQIGRLLLLDEVEGGPDRAQPPGAQGELKAPGRRDDRRVESGGSGIARPVRSTDDAGNHQQRNPLEDFVHTLEVNLVGTYHASQMVGRHVLERGSGSIINVASILGFVSGSPIPQPGYAASKGALINLSRELAAQWGRRGVRVNALCPGWFQTEMTDGMFTTEEGLRWIQRKTALGRVGGEADLDGALLWLASDASVYVTGSSIVVDGGYLTM